MSEQGPGCVDISPVSQEGQSAESAWEALHASLCELLPPCHARDLFTADRLSDEQMTECAAICQRCPVLELCDAYATAARPPSGFWAGRFYSPKGIATAPSGTRQTTERQDHE